MKTTRIMLVSCAAVVAAVFAMASEPLSDDAMKKKIVDFVTLPGRLCGHALVDFRDEFRGRKLTNRNWFDGDTNRLARLIAELAQTNDVSLSSQMIVSLGKYGTPAQLPFLYSCVTNVQFGAEALRSIFAIEGITSNSVETLHRYLFFTNIVTSKTVYEKATVCKEVLETLCESSVTSDLFDDATFVVRHYASNVSTGVSMIDTALVQADTTYRYSKRRLSDLRAAYPRSFNEYQTTYVTNAINELVSYPEADLPD